MLRLAIHSAMALLALLIIVTVATAQRRLPADNGARPKPPRPAAETPKRPPLTAPRSTDTKSQQKKSDPSNEWQRLYEAGVSAHKQGRTEEAERLLTEALQQVEKLSPEDQRLASVLTGLGCLYLVERRFAQAEALFKRSQAILEQHLAPDHQDLQSNRVNLTELYKARGAACAQKEDYDSAIADYRKALAVTPADAGTNRTLAGLLFKRGSARAGQGRQADAIDDFTNAIAHDGGNGALFVARAVARLQHGSYLEAISDYQRARELDVSAVTPYQADFAKLYVKLGLAKFQTGSYTEASGYFTDAIALDAGCAAAYGHRAITRFNSSDVNGAIEDFTRAIALEKSAAITDLYNRRGRARESKGDLEGALADYSLAIAADGKNSVAYANRAALKQLRGDLEGALADYLVARQHDAEGGAALRYKIASIYIGISSEKAKRSDLDGAIQELNRAIEVDGKNIRAYFNRGTIRYNTKDFTGALSDLTRVIELNGKYAAAYALRAFVYYKLGMIKEAQHDSKIARQLDAKAHTPF